MINLSVDTDSPSNSIDAVARHVIIAQINCFDTVPSSSLLHYVFNSIVSTTLHNTLCPLKKN